MTKTTEDGGWIVHGNMRHGKSGRNSCGICARDNLAKIRDCLSSLEEYVENTESMHHD